MRGQTGVRDFWLKVFQNVVARLLVIAVIASLTGLLGYFYGRMAERRLYERRYESATEIYLSGLDSMIPEAASSEGPTMIAKARALVYLRDELRAAPAGIAKGLNHEFDELSALLMSYEEEPSRELESAIHRRLLYLRETWPWKRQPIETGLRQLITYLGFYEVAGGKRGRE